MIKMKQHFNKRIFTIGGDPEFVLRNTVKKCLERAKDHAFFNKVGEDYKIGRDGAAHPVEIRPYPTYINKLEIMIDDIENIIKKISVYCNKNNLSIQCGAMPFEIPIGGHIHFGGRDIMSGGLSQREYNIVKGNQKKLVNALDFYLAPIFLSLLNPLEISRRMNSGYGKIHEYRKQPWGIEYRTPYSFLASPSITKGIYGLSCLIAHHYKYLKVEPNKVDLVYNFQKDIRDRIKAKDSFKIIYKQTKPKIVKLMSMYSPNPQYNPNILSLFNLIERNKVINCRDVIACYGLKEKENQPIISLNTFNTKLNIIGNRIHKILSGKIANILLEPIFGSVDQIIFYYDNRYPKPTFPHNVKILSLGYFKTVFDVHIGLSLGLIEKAYNKPNYVKIISKIINKMLKSHV